MNNQEAKQLLDNYRPLSPIVNKTYDSIISIQRLNSFDWKLIVYWKG